MDSGEQAVFEARLEQADELLDSEQKVNSFHMV